MEVTGSRHGQGQGQGVRPGSRAGRGGTRGVAHSPRGVLVQAQASGAALGPRGGGDAGGGAGKDVLLSLSPARSRRSAELEGMSRVSGGRSAGGSSGSRGSRSGSSGGSGVQRRAMRAEGEPENDGNASLEPYRVDLSGLSRAASGTGSAPSEEESGGRGEAGDGGDYTTSLGSAGRRRIELTNSISRRARSMDSADDPDPRVGSSVVYEVCDASQGTRTGT